MKSKLTALLAILPLFLTTALAVGADEAPKPYPLETCLVSGEKLGEMGDPYVITYEGQEIKFCCKDCEKDFNKDPDKYLAKLKKAEKKMDAHAGHAHD